MMKGGATHGNLSKVGRGDGLSPTGWPLDSKEMPITSGRGLARQLRLAEL